MTSDVRQYFKGKKITIMGLGLLGRGLNIVKFLHNLGSNLLVTDLKDRELLEPSLSELRTLKNIKYVLGRHQLKDFKNQDIIIKAAGVPLDSLFTKEAHKNNIPVEMDASLFAKLTDSTLIGVTGTRGKSTTAYLIYEILKRADKRVFLAGNIKDTATLPLLRKTKKGDIVILELDSWQLQGFGDSKISPEIAIFTSFMPDHMNYYKNSMKKYFNDKANIFKYQNTTDHLVVGEGVNKIIKKFYKSRIKSRVINASAKDLPKSWKLKLKGEHNKNNAACAIRAALILNVRTDIIKKVVENFSSLPGRLELVRIFRGIKIYNDTNSTTPEATIAGLKALSDRKNTILIMGGSDKNLDPSKLLGVIPKYSKRVILTPGTGTEKIKNRTKNLKNVEETDTLEEAISKAIDFSNKGDTILFSPGFASFGLFKNEYDRGEKFVRLIKKLSGVQ